jgi:ketosteroid isomerase-like protein
MKRAVWLAAGVCVALVGLGIVARAEMTAAVRAIVEQERAFSAASVAKSTRDAFMEFLADDSLLFRPGPVPGKMFVRNRPAPPGKLVWAPAFADAASSEDIGYTTGPYEFRKAEMTETPTSWGHYLSIWRKQRDGSWKVEVELGISHEKFPTAVADVKDVATPPASAGGDAKPGGAKPADAKPDAAKPAGAKPAATTGAPAAAGASKSATKPAAGTPASGASANPPAAGAGAAPAANSAKPPAAGAGANPATLAKPTGTANPPAAGATPAANSAKPPAAGAQANPANPATPPAAGGTANPPAAGATPVPAAPLSPAKQAEEALKEVDRTFSKAVAEQGAVKAFAAMTSANIRIYRNGSMPIVGKAALEAMQANALGSSWQPAHARVSASGDFGYTTGMMTMGAAPTPGSQGQPQYYVRVWRKDKSGAWKVELDIVN